MWCQINEQVTQNYRESERKTHKKDIEFSEIEKICEYYGFIKRDGKGSHYIFTHSLYKELNISIPKPHNNSKEVKRVYIKLIQEFIEYIEYKEKNNE